ncbi:unnamed protein product [Linum trigynum]|uniref:Uncharacterized protein n=1 Tax=Linum trigynum TaxID=586398 RepID=A0AAV2G4N5_9ROSI
MAPSQQASSFAVNDFQGVADKMKKGETSNDKLQGRVSGNPPKQKGEPKEKKPPDGATKGSKAKQSSPDMNQERKSGGAAQECQKEDISSSRKIVFGPEKEGAEKEKSSNSKPSEKVESKKENGATAMAVDSK